MRARKRRDGHHALLTHLGLARRRGAGAGAGGSKASREAEPQRALTDHDEIGGQARAAAAAQACGMRYLNGVEISVTFLNKTVHIVGLGFDPENAALREGLEHTRGGRRLRAQEMSDGLARVGIRGAFEGALRYVGNPDLISRTHFARHLVETGVCKDTNEVFRKYLTEGKPGYVEHRWATLQDAMRMR